AKGSLAVGDYILLKKEGTGFRRAMLTDLGAEKQAVVPALFIKPEDAKGAWRNQLEKEDYIFEIDNKGLTNRPDLWGHRGLAREIAALFDCDLKSEDYIFATKMIKHFDYTAPANGGFGV